MAVYNWSTADAYMAGARDKEAGRPLPGKSTRLVKIRHWREPSGLEEAYAVRYHSTNVVTYNADGTITLNTNGWTTATTKSRIVQYSPVTIQSHGWEWVVITPAGRAAMNAAYDAIDRSSEPAYPAYYYAAPCTQGHYYGEDITPRESCEQCKAFDAAFPQYQRDRKAYNKAHRAWARIHEAEYRRIVKENQIPFYDGMTFTEAGDLISR